MKKKPLVYQPKLKRRLAYYLDLMKSAGDRQDWGKAKRHGEIALKNLPRLSYTPSEEYLLYCCIAESYANLANHAHSLNFLHKADRLAILHRFKPPYHAYISFRIGNNLLWLNQFSQAITNFRKADQYYQKYGMETIPMDRNIYLTLMIRLGYCYLYKNNLEDVKEIIEKTLASKLPFESDDILAKYYHLKGEYQLELKKYQESRQSFYKSLSISESIKSHRMVLGTNFHLAEIELLAGRLETAVKGLEALFKESRRLKFNNFICRIGLLLSKCYAIQKSPNKSAAIQKKIKPALNKLEPVWLYESIHKYELIYQRLQEIYPATQKEFHEMSQILAQTFTRYNEASYYKYIVGQSPLMREVYQLIEKIAPTDLPVLIQGETGTGKELIARAIHNHSLRKAKEWSALNCGAVTETLLENELFGHVKGAFTDAHQDKKGHIELASKGTLFLDEIAEMSPNMQQKLLRVMDERLIWRVGSERSITVNTRFIFASNQNIKEMVAKKLFRKELFYRINTITITLPPLRERKEDIPLLVKHFLDKYTVSPKSEIRIPKSEIEVTPDALRLFVDYPWPGNVRELENEIKRICALHQNVKQITANMLSESIRNYRIMPDSGLTSFKEARKLAEKNLIINSIQKSNSNIIQAAHLLGCSRRYLYQKVKQLKVNLKSMRITK